MGLYFVTWKNGGVSREQKNQVEYYLMHTVLAPEIAYITDVLGNRCYEKELAAIAQWA